MMQCFSYADPEYSYELSAQRNSTIYDEVGGTGNIQTKFFLRAVDHKKALMNIVPSS